MSRWGVGAYPVRASYYVLRTSYSGNGRDSFDNLMEIAGARLWCLSFPARPQIP